MGVEIHIIWPVTNTWHSVRFAWTQCWSYGKMRNSPSNTAMPATWKCNVDPKSICKLTFQWVTKLYILGLSLYFIVALTGQRFPFPAYKPAFRQGLFAFSAFVTKHNSLARETAYLLSPKKKDAFPKLTKKIAPIAKPFPAILRFKTT